MSPTPVVAPPPPGDPDRIGRRERFGLLRSRADTKVSPYLYIAPFFLLFAHLRPLPAALHRLGLAARLAAGQRRPHLVGPGQLPAAAHRPGLLERALEHLRDLRALDRAAADCSRCSWPACSTAGCAAVRSSGWRCILPTATSVAAVSIVFSQLFSRDFGLVNWVLGGVGRRSPSTGRRRSGRPGPPSRSMVNWRWTGYNALIYLAAMQADPARPVRGRRARRRRRPGSSSPGHGPAAAADDPVHGHHLHHRRLPALRRAAAVQLRLVQLPGRLRCASPRPCPCTSGRALRASSTSATPRRSPGCCS